MLQVFMDGYKVALEYIRNFLPVLVRLFENKTLKELPVLLWLIKKTSEILRTAGYYVCTQALNR
jgi:hypothetical protein